MMGEVFYIFTRTGKDDSHNSQVPLKPPPRIWHISLSAARSSLLFFALGTPSEGVISPTIAVKIKYN